MSVASNGGRQFDNDDLAAPGLSIQMKLARLIKLGGLLVRSRPRRTTALLALSASDQTIDLAGVNLQLKRGHLMPRDAGPMVSKLTAADRPVFAHRWMMRVLDFARITSIRCICPKHSQAANSTASGACRCRLSAPAAQSVAYLNFTPVIGASRGLCLRLFRRAGWLGAGCAHIVKSLQAGPGRLPSSER